MIRQYAESTAARLYEPLLGGVLRGLRERVVALCPTRGAILDCGCGPGGVLRLLTGCPAVKTVTGVDTSPVMLREAKHNAPSAQFVQADGASLPFADKSFDAACICLVLHSLPLHKASAIVCELRRVAHTVIIADYILAERNLALPAVALSHAIELCVGGEHYRNYCAFMRQGALEGLLHRQGMYISARHYALGGAALVCECPLHMSHRP